MDDPPIWLLVIFSLLGGGLLVGAIHSYVWKRSFLRRAIDADGIVVGFEEGYDEGTIYYVRVEFETHDHTKHTHTSNHYSNWKNYSVGQAVRVLYDPGRPQDARISTQLNDGEVLGGIMGTMFLFVALMWLWDLYIH